MALSLSNIFQRPYVSQDTRSRVKRREDEQRSTTSDAQREDNGQNTKSKGLQYVEQKRPTYTPAYEQKFVPNAYSSVNINAPQNIRTTQNTATSYIQNAQPQTPQTINPQINIAQILKDFKNTAIAIGTPEDVTEEVNGYIALIEKQVRKPSPNAKIIRTNLNSAASLLDEHISKTLNKDSKVVQNWVDTLFLQKINFKYDENDINERFLVKFPDGSTSATKRSEERQETSSDEEIVSTIENNNVIPIAVAGNSLKIPQDKELKHLFIQAKKYAYAQDPEKAIKSFEKALNRANELDDTETSGKIYYEVGKIYDDHNYFPQALKSYRHSIKLTTDENVKAKAYYSMAQIYDDVNQITPAIAHYMSAVSHAGEADNLPAQSASLTKVGNIYTDMYDKEAFNYYDIANDVAEQTDNNNLKGFVASNTAKAHVKFDEPEKALKLYSSAVKDYTEGKSPVKAAQNYVAAADIMVEFNNIEKAHKLLKKALACARKSENVNLMSEINTKLGQLEQLYT